MALMSMTGFGAATFEVGGQHWRLELKSVNHKALAFRMHVPHELGRYPELEALAQTAVKQRLLRGSVELSLSLESDATPIEVVLDRPALSALMRELMQLAAELGAPPPTLELALRQGNLLAFRKKEHDHEAFMAAFSAALDTALTRHIAMRETEGASLVTDLMARLTSLDVMLNAVETEGPKVTAALMERLKTRVAKVESELGVELDQARILSELVVFSDRSDVTEELVRARAHLEQFRQTLSSNEHTERGRRLDFLTQELLRELNTLGSKCRDAGVASAVVDAKVELEKIREQSQNIA